jgi:hypothetical protein
MPPLACQEALLYRPAVDSLLERCYRFEVIADTPLGKGCIATEKIHKDEIICKMIGPLMTAERSKGASDQCNPLQIGPGTYLDLVKPYVNFNHSCDPNAGLRNDGILFALREIKPGEEIRYDYSTTVDEPMWMMECQCRCGARNCRGEIGDFQTIPHHRKEFYRSRGALMRHIFQLYY